ncbi:MAG: PBP1A family penicillin-binding protein [Deltaproteobacteria bacterium]|nr:MAG: PBP1A family penicillin-binding protein [Deltaproteobacteria bacterium]
MRLALGLIAFVAGFATAVLVVRLDRTVTQRFEGRLFRVPSRVFSAPTVLYPGIDAWRIDLRGTLQRLGYREEIRHASGGGPLERGRFVWGGSQVMVNLRPFEHPTRSEPGREVVIQLADGVIQDIVDARVGGSVAAVLLEPERVGAYYGPDREQRELVRLDEVPRHLIDAVLAVEDQRFEQHPGIDFRRIGGALLANLREGRVAQGGSTLTQQLVKNFFLSPERTLRRKLREALMALLIEFRYGKEAILESYLNEIYLGQRGSTAVHGVGEASRFYFGKAARDLSVAESALLAAIIQSPNAISPFREADRALRRRNLVLRLMHGQGRIDDASLETASAEPLRLASVTKDRSEVRYFLDALRRQLPDVYDADVLMTEGLDIYSTIDVRLQRLAARALREGLDDLEQRDPRLRGDGSGHPLQGCLIALRPQTGEVLALVGGRDYGASQFDRCTQARRPAGSVFKPFVFIAGLEPGPDGSAITLASRLDDGPLRVVTPLGPWEPENYDRQYHDLVTVREALERSLNVATARLALEVGVDRVADVARRLGVESHLPRVPSLALGSADVSPLEIGRAYATIANGGIRPEIRTFEDVVERSGETLARHEIRFERVLDAGTAYLSISLLEGVVERGTARGVRAAGLHGPLAGKTGTSDRERDAWFVGFAPELVVVVWVGYDDPRSIGLPGSRAALPIWTRFVLDATGGTPRGAFLPPPEIVEVGIEPSTGALALSGCPDRQPEVFLSGTEPTEVCGEGAVAQRGPGSGSDRAPRGGWLGWLRDVLE